jgi:cytochrome o ubiquinol oxidase subunit 2
MFRKAKIPVFIVLVLGVIASAVAYLRTVNIAVLQPRGTIAQQQRSLMLIASLLAVVVVVPVFIMTIVICWKYRANRVTKGKKATYTPEVGSNKLFESLWWGIPIAIIFVLSIITWNSSHSLDPYRPLASKTKPLHIQVVALQWKWLFLYPDQHVASINEVHIPVNTPIDFDITSDAPMNSFWIPQLAGQVYAMSGMNTQLHIMASKPGTYRGSSANISGRGFADMHFNAIAGSASDFTEWVNYAKSNDSKLTDSSYKSLALPSDNAPASSMQLVSNDLYDTIVMKYMMPTDGSSDSGEHAGTTQNMNGMQGMNE